MHTGNFYKIYINYLFYYPDLTHIITRIAFPNLGTLSLADFNPLPTSDTVRGQKNLFWRIFLVQHCHNLKNITPLET